MNESSYPLSLPMEDRGSWDSNFLQDAWNPESLLGKVKVALLYFPLFWSPLVFVGRLFPLLPNSTLLGRVGAVREIQHALNKAVSL